MNRTPLIAAAILTAATAAAITLASPTFSFAANACANAQAIASGLSQQVTKNLQESGFTNVKVMPNSFLVQANDKSGNPVRMFHHTEFDGRNYNSQKIGQSGNDIPYA